MKEYANVGLRRARTARATATIAATQCEPGLPGATLGPQHASIHVRNESQGQPWGPRIRVFTCVGVFSALVVP